MATSAFGKAFRAAREAGDTEFEFGGKKYNTKLKDDSSSKIAALAAKGQAGNKAMQEEEEKSSTGPDSASKNLGSAVGSRKVQPDFTPGKVPSSEQAAANRKAAADTVKSAANAVGDYFSNFETPAERRSREAKEVKNPSPKPAPKESEEVPYRSKNITDWLGLSSNTRKPGDADSSYKKGGSVSSRADGIAQRGKTRGKMC